MEQVDMGQVEALDLVDMDLMEVDFNLVVMDLMEVDFNLVVMDLSEEAV